MNKLNKLLILIFLAFNTSIVKAENEIDILSLDQVLNLAYENNLSLKISNKNRNINEAELITAGLYPNPELFLAAGVAQKTYNPGIQQKIPLGGKIKHRKKLVASKFDVIDNEIKQTAINLRYEVKKLFYQILNLESKAEVYQKLLDATEETLKSTQRRFELKEITILDLRQIEMLSIDIKKAAIANEIEIKKTRNKLNQILNFDISGKELVVYENENSELVKLLQSKTNEELIELAKENRPDINANEAKLGVNSEEKDLARANIYPDLTLGVAPDIVTGDEGGISVFTQLQLGLPIFDRQQGELKKIKELKEQLILEKNEIELLIELEIKNSLNNYQMSSQQLKLYQDDSLEKSEEFIEKAQKSYKLGKSLVLTFLEAVKSSESIYLGYLNTKLAYQETLVELEKLLAIN